MPWTSAEAQGHTGKANTPKLQAMWAEIANERLGACLEDGGEEGACEASAIRQANAVVAEQVEKSSQLYLELLLEEVRRRVPYDAFWKEWIKTARAKAGGMTSPKPVEKQDVEIDRKTEIVKYDEFEGLLYGVVMEPDTKDAQGDVTSEEEILKAAHGWMVRSQVYDLEHEDMVGKDEARVVESYVTPQDVVYEHEGGKTTVAKGSWVAVTKLLDEGLKDLAKAGEIGFYSIRGYGHRKELDNDDGTE